MNEKTYKIDNQLFRLKELTLDEADRVKKLIQISGDIAEVSNDNSKTFLNIVLEPCTPLTNECSVDFGRTTEYTALEVLKDFFTVRIENQKKLKDYFLSLTSAQEPLQKNTSG